MKNIALHIILLMFLTGSLKAQNDRDSLNSNFINKQIDILKLHRSEKPVNEKIYRIWLMIIRYSNLLPTKNIR